MSSSYHLLCLDHDPPLQLDKGWNSEPTHDQFSAAGLSSDHKDCDLGIGKYSGALYEIWLPISFYDKDGWHRGQWFDVSWIHHKSNNAVMCLLQSCIEGGE